MNSAFYFFFFISIFTFSSFSASENCIKDILSSGLSFDSVAYKGKKGEQDYATLATDSAIGLKGSWIIFCPQKKMELNVYSKLRFLTFTDSLSNNVFRGVKAKETLPSFGLEGRFNHFFNNPKIEIPFDFEVRNELGMIANDNQSFLTSKKYWNTKLMSGVRYFLWRKGKRQITCVGKLGALIPLSGNGEDTSLGSIYGLSGEYYQKMGKKASLQADLFYDIYNQDYGNLEMSRRELGLRMNFVFRI